MFSVGGILPVLPNILQRGDVDVLNEEVCTERFQGVGGASLNDGHICVSMWNETGACSVSNYQC